MICHTRLFWHYNVVVRVRWNKAWTWGGVGACMWCLTRDERLMKRWEGRVMSSKHTLTTSHGHTSVSRRTTAWAGHPQHFPAFAGINRPRKTLKPRRAQWATYRLVKIQLLFGELLLFCQVRIRLPSCFSSFWRWPFLWPALRHVS